MGKIIHPERLEKRLHPHLVAVFHRAADLYSVDMMVLPSVRTMDEQRELVRLGKSRTLHSRHVIENNKCGYSCAIDAIPVTKDGEPDWAWTGVSLFNKDMQIASHTLSIPVEWGGAWKHFKDGDHWQLPWAVYP